MNRDQPPARLPRATRAAALALCLLVFSGEAGAQEPPTYRSTAEIVRLQVAVFGADGLPVTDLEAGDFTVREHGDERRLSVFLPPDEGPLEIALLMDVSGSMSYWDSRPLFHSILDGLPPESCVLLVPFDERVRPGLWGHPGDVWLRAVVEGTFQDGLAEAVYDAFVVAFSRLRERAAGVSAAGLNELLRFRSPRPGAPPVAPPAGECEPGRARGAMRRAVVVLTDQVDSASIARLPDVILASWGSGIPIFALAVTRAEGRSGISSSVRAFSRRAEAQQRHYLEALETLSRYTGGLVVRGVRERRGRFGRFRARGSELPISEAVERLVRSLRAHYVLGFVPPEESGRMFAQETEVEVRVAGDDLEVFTTGQLARGEGKSEGAAMDLALRGFDALTAGRPEEALREFDSALRMAPELGLSHYGRAIALALAGRPAASLPAFAEARRRAPWLPDLDARVAAAHLEAGDPASAWPHALRAHYRGSDVARLIERLQSVAPRTVDLDRPPENPRVAVRAGVPNEIGLGFAADRLVATVWNLAAGSDVMHGGWAPETSDLVLRIELRSSEVRRSPRAITVMIRGRLMLLDRAGEELTSQPFTVGNILDVEATVRDLELPFRSIETAVRSFHQFPER